MEQFNNKMQGLRALHFFLYRCLIFKNRIHGINIFRIQLYVLFSGTYKLFSNFKENMFTIICICQFLLLLSIEFIIMLASGQSYFWT